MSKYIDPLLNDQVTFESSFQTWFDEGLYGILHDNRRRYRMELLDKEEREGLGLSAIPSTKSTGAVDRSVEKALMEYHGEPDAITFVPRGLHDVTKAEQCRWLTEIFKYRKDHTFPFFSWHSASLTASYTDGIEAAMVSWVYETYKDKITKYYMTDETGTQEVDEEIYNIGRQLHPDLFYTQQVTEEVISKDTFWIDPLKPGEDICWDVKIPFLNLELCRKVLVKINKSKEYIANMAKYGLFNKYVEADLMGHEVDGPEYDDQYESMANPDDADFENLEQYRVWVFFEKIKNRWMVTFSVEGEVPLSTRKTVDEVFYAGRKVNRLPVAMGCIKSKLWEAVGRGIPESIAPIEDEWSDNRNNINDAAKIAIQGRWRIGQLAEVDLNQLLNARAFRADKSEVEKIDTAFNVIDSLRTSDLLNQDMAEMIPVGMENKTIVPRGTAKTLGAVELGLGAQNQKLSVHLLHRNETFFVPILNIIGHMIVAYETDETIMKIAADNASVNMSQPDGNAVNLKSLDVDFQVVVNAGHGTMTKEQKAKLMMELGEWRKSHGVPTDFMAIAGQLNVMAGFKEQAFTPESVPPPPGPELRADIKVDLNMLSPEIQAAIMQKFMQGSQEIKVNATKETPDFKPDGDGKPRKSDMIQDQDPNGLALSPADQQGGTGGYN